MSPAPSPPAITLLTDFGTRDGYVGAVKGVLAEGAPGASLHDIGHDLPRGDVLAAARVVERYWARWPSGTVHLVVVDPGVGTARRALACRAEGRLLVAPDNGVLTRVLGAAPGAICVAVDPARVPGPLSATFHGRDLFAPVAARLAAGAPLESLGEVVGDPVLRDEARPWRGGGEGVGEVVYVDRFGNAVTNLPGSWVGKGTRVEVAGRQLPVRTTYGEVAEGEAVAVVNSDGLVEVAVRDGSAADVLGIGSGQVVRLVG